MLITTLGLGLRVIGAFATRAFLGLGSAAASSSVLVLRLRAGGAGKAPSTALVSRVVDVFSRLVVVTFAPASTTAFAAVLSFVFFVSVVEAAVFFCVFASDAGAAFFTPAFLAIVVLVAVFAGAFAVAVLTRVEERAGAIVGREALGEVGLLSCNKQMVRFVAVSGLNYSTLCICPQEV